ncbi:MAG: DinB family protein [Terriglobales bacterium]
MTETARIADQLERAFRGEAWHGPAMMEILRGVPVDQAAAHPITHAHSIWEIVLHVTAWQRVVLRRMHDEAATLTREQDWPGVPRFSESEWQAAVHALEESHRKLHAGIMAMPDDRLHARVPGKDYNFYVLLHGAVQHLLYHAGQIAILKKG